MGHAPGPEWESKRKKPMLYCWSCLQCCTVLFALIMTIVSQSSIKGGYVENLNVLSSLPVGDISSAT